MIYLTFKDYFGGDGFSIVSVARRWYLLYVIGQILKAYLRPLLQAAFNSLPVSFLRILERPRLGIDYQGL